MRDAIVSIAVIAASACGHSPAAPDGPVNQLVVLAPGQSISIDRTSAELRFDRVSGDSRCPADAFCITGGDAVVQITVTEHRQPAEYGLHTGDLRPITHGALTIALEQLRPYPFSAHPIAPGDYRATLRVTK